MTTTAPLFLTTPRLSLLRRGLIALGVAVSVAVWGGEIAQKPHKIAGPGMMLVPLVATLFLASVNRTGAQLVCRGVWWLSLLFGTLLAVNGFGGKAALLAVGGGVALLSAWTAGLGGETGGGFEPVAFRRSLVVSLVMAVAEVQFLAVGSAMRLQQGHQGDGLGLGACALLLALGALGVYRLRFWGVLVHLLAVGGVAAVVVPVMTRINGVNASLLWIGTVAIQMLLPLPMLLAILRRRRVSVASEPPPLLPGLFVTLVLAMVGLSLFCGRSPGWETHLL